MILRITTRVAMSVIYYYLHEMRYKQKDRVLVLYFLL